jgi:putative ABC transport system permease protein
VRVEDARRALQAVWVRAFRWNRPARAAAQFEAMAQVYSMTANVTSIFALFIGLFLIYNTFNIAVTQRRSEIGILRALGATRGQIRGLFLIESGIAGLAGSLIGLGGRVDRPRPGELLQRHPRRGLWRGAARRRGFADPRLLLASLVIGVVTSLIAGWIPARAAASASIR